MSFELSFLHCGYDRHCTAVVDKHFVGYSTLQLMTRGAVDLSYDARTFTLADGTWLWPAYPGPRIRFHRAAGCREWEHRYVAVRGPLLAHWASAGLWPDGPQRSPAGKTVVAAFDELLACAKATDRWDARRGVNLLERILIDLAAARQQADVAEPWVTRVMELLDGRALAGEDAAIDYADVAADVGLGASTLRRNFRRATGVSPHQYVLQARLLEARRLLGETDLPVKAIARRLGYSDLYFFTRQFRQHVGVPPAAYRTSRQ